MNSLCRTLIVLGAFLAAAYGLKCRQCDAGILGVCLLGTEITCGAGTDTCYKTEAQFNETTAVTFVTRGCRNATGCGDTATGTILGIGYNIKSYCCSQDLCNSASSLQLSITAGVLLAGLSTLWASL
ncbi:lymphocyte antigen-6, epidermis [Boleophthalmus pectinirostris]|uniref:lymphocyte antigen-6, epidermis n=1 Tax=Boleophthalmus pectinirostris TaxID=150288 RepID=UPI000A1C740A|nr:lymphocyte antigen-6, epidermis [Boleophthalmus pectinirostris]